MRSADHIHSPTPEDIMEYLDGEGTAASRAAIAAHLASCAACQALVGRTARHLRTTRGAWTVAAGSGIAAGRRPRRPVRACWRPIAARSLAGLVGRRGRPGRGRRDQQSARSALCRSPSRRRQSRERVRRAAPGGRTAPARAGGGWQGAAADGRAHSMAASRSVPGRPTPPGRARCARRRSSAPPRCRSSPRTSRRARASVEAHRRTAPPDSSIT